MMSLSPILVTHTILTARITLHIREEAQAETRRGGRTEETGHWYQDQDGTMDMLDTMPTGGGITTVSS